VQRRGVDGRVVGLQQPGLAARSEQAPAAAQVFTKGQQEEGRGSKMRDLPGWVGRSAGEFDQQKDEAKDKQDDG